MMARLGYSEVKDEFLASTFKMAEDLRAERELNALLRRERDEARASEKFFRQQFDDQVASRAEVEAELAQCREALERRTRAGRQMANVLFNLSQDAAGLINDPAMRTAMREVQEAWDAARAALPAAPSTGGGE